MPPAAPDALASSASANLIRPRPWLVGILALAIVARFGLLLSLADDPNRYVQSDAGGYDRIALNLARHGAFSVSESPPFVPDAFRTPVYPYFLAAFYALFGHQLVAVVAAQSLISAACVYLVFRLGERLLGTAAGLAAAAFMAVDVGLIIHANLLLTETVYVLLLILALWALWSLAATGHLRHAVAAGLWLGLGTLCRPLAQYLPLALAAVAFLSVRRDWPRRLAAAGLLLAMYAAVLSPWLLRNQLVFGRAQLSSVQGINLFFFNAGYLRAQLTGTSLEEGQAQLYDEIQPALLEAGSDPFRQADVYQAYALREIARHPLAYVWLSAQGGALMLVLPNTNFLANMLGMLNTPTGLIANLRTRTVAENVAALGQFYRDYFMHSPERAAFFVATLIELFTLASAYAFCLLAVIRLIRRRRWLVLGLLGLPFAYFVALTGPVGYGRYRMPAAPIIALVAGAGVAAWLEWRRARQAPPPPSAGPA